MMSSQNKFISLFSIVLLISPFVISGERGFADGYSYTTQEEQTLDNKNQDIETSKEEIASESLSDDQWPSQEMVRDEMKLKPISDSKEENLESDVDEGRLIISEIDDDKPNVINEENLRESHPPLSQTVMELGKVFNPPIGDLPGIDSSGKFLNITDRNGQLGAIWGKYKLDLKYDFTLDSYMYFGNKKQKAADGMTFTLQNTGPKAIGGGGQELGAYGPYMKGISIEFDTYHNGNGLDKDVPIHDTYDHTAFFDIANRRHLQYQTVINPDSDDQLSAGYWYKIRVSWTANNKKLRYQLSALNSSDRFSKQDKSITLDTYKLFGEEYPSVWWGYTGSTGEQWTTNTLAFQTLPQPSNQEVSLEVRGTENEDISAYDQDIITLKVKRNALYNLWADVNTTIDYSKAANMLTYIPDSLEVNGKKVTPSSHSNGKITLPKTSIDKTSDLVTLKFKGKYVNYDKKAIKVNTTGTERVYLSDGTGLSYLDGSEETVNIKVKPDLISIDAKDTTINIDDKWQSKDNFVSATNEDGDKVDFSSSKISVTPNTLDTSKAGKYKINYKYEGILKKVNKEATVTVYDNRPVSATAVPQVYALGRDLSYIKPEDLIKDTKIGSESVGSDAYTLKVKKLPDSNTVGKKEIIITITRKLNGVENDIKVPIEINWGNSLKLNGNDLQTIMALTTHKSGSGYSVIATRAQADKNNELIQPQVQNEYVKIGLAHTESKPLTDLKPYYETSLKGIDKIETAYSKFVRQEAEVGDIVKVTHEELTTGPNFIGRFNEDNWNPPSGYLNKEAYFEISKDGQFLDVHVNQLKAKKGILPIFSDNQYLDQHIKEYVDLRGYSNIEVKKFSAYPKTNKTGETSGKIVVEETLKSGKKVQWEYEVPFTVLEGSLDLSVPKTLTFKEFSPSKSEQTIQRKFTGDLGLTIKDSRGNEKQGGWHLTAKIQKKTTGIAPYMVFSKKGESDKSLMDAALVYSQPKQGDVSEPLEVKVTTLWGNDEGILLKIPPKSKLESNKTYSETINWNLVEGP